MRMLLIGVSEVPPTWLVCVVWVFFACLNDTDQARLTELLRELIEFIPDQR